MNVEKKSGVFCGSPSSIIVRHRMGRVILIIDGAAIELKTPSAFKLGFGLASQAGNLLQSEFLSFKINGKEVQLLKEAALKVGGSLLKKCDEADDFQLISKGAA